MKVLLASNGEVKKIEFPKISAEDMREMVKQMKAHKDDPKIKFYDYVGCIVPIDREPLRNADQLLGYEKR